MLAKKLSTHHLRPILEELVHAIQIGISYEQDPSSIKLTVMDVQKIDIDRLHAVLHDCQSRHGKNYTIKQAYTANIAFRTPQCTRMTSYDCIFYRDGEEHGISFLPHDGLFDILGYKD